MRGFGPLFGAEHDGKIVGICGLQPDPIEEKTLQLRHGYVLPEWRQLGIGSAMLNRRDAMAWMFDGNAWTEIGHA